MFDLWNQVDVIWKPCHKTGQVLNPTARWETWPPAERCRLVSSSTSLWVNVCVHVCMYVLCMCVCMYIWMCVPHNVLQYIFVIIYSAIRMWIGFNYGAFLNSCRVSLNVKDIKLSEDAAFWVMWLCTAHSCVVALGCVKVYSTQLCGCSGLCSCVQHTAAWLLWVMWLCTAHSCVVALGYVAVYSTQLRGCSGLCDGLQHTTVWLLWVM